MRRRWFWIRVVILTLAACAVGGYLFTQGNWRHWLAGEASYSQEVREGDTIAAAIYQFRARRGLWPEYLEDLAPEFLPVPPGRGWFYQLDVTPGGRRVPALSTDATREGADKAHLGYDFDAASPSWRVYGGVPTRVVRTGPPAGAATATRGGLEAQLAELDRRIAREPAMLEHWQAKAALLVARGKRDDAKDVVIKAQQALPAAAWPRFAQAVLAMDAAGIAGRSTAMELPGVKAFVAWAESAPTLTRRYEVFWLLRRTGQDAKAAAMLPGFETVAIEVDADDSYVASFYLFDMARWALTQGYLEPCRSLCDTWERAFAGGKVRDQSFWAIRAGAKWASGDQAGARADLEQARKAGRSWARNLAALGDAIEKGDAKFRYDPGTLPGDLQVFVPPE